MAFDPCHFVVCTGCGIPPLLVRTDRYEVVCVYKKALDAEKEQGYTFYEDKGCAKNRTAIRRRDTATEKGKAKESAEGEEKEIQRTTVGYFGTA